MSVKMSQRIKNKMTGDRMSMWGTTVSQPDTNLTKDNKLVTIKNVRPRYHFQNLTKNGPKFEGNNQTTTKKSRKPYNVIPSSRSHFNSTLQQQQQVKDTRVPDFDLGNFDENEEILVNITHEPHPIMPMYLQHYSYRHNNGYFDMRNEVGHHYPSFFGNSSFYSHSTPFQQQQQQQQPSIVQEQFDLTDIFKGWDDAMSKFWWKVLSPLSFNALPTQEIAGPNWISDPMLESLKSSFKDPIKSRGRMRKRSTIGCCSTNNDSPRRPKKPKTSKSACSSSNGPTENALGNNNSKNNNRTSKMTKKHFAK